MSRLVILIIILLLLVLLLYKNIIILDFWISLEDPIYRWILPLIFILLFSLTLFLSNVNQVFFLINFSAVLIALYLTEYILIKRTVTDIHENYARGQGIPFDSRSFSEVVNEKKSVGKISHAFTKGNLFKKNKEDYFSLASHSNASIVHCNEAGEWVFFQSDEYGFNNPLGSFDKSFYQIIGIGDSFTSGYCVPENYSFMSLIKKDYPLTLNLGVTGTGPLHQLAILKEYVSSLKSKVILWNFFEGNDLQELDMEKKNIFLKNYLKTDHSQKLKEKQLYINKSIIEKNKGKDFDREEPRKNFSIGKFVFLDALRTHLGLYKQTKKTKSFDLNLLESILTVARDFSEGIGAEMIFVYIPSVDRSLGFRGRHTINHYKDDIIKLVKNLNISLIDISLTISDHVDPLSLYNSRIGYHFNRSGNKLLSEIILDSLIHIDSLHE